MVHLVQTGQLLAVRNRAGNVHDSEDALNLLSFLASDLREQLGPRRLEVRLDGAFFRREIIEFLNAARTDYVIRAPLWDWLSIRPEIAKSKRWRRIGQGIEAFSVKFRIPKW